MKIIRTLWGRDGGPLLRWSKVMKQDVIPRLNQNESCPFTVYVYGRNNADFLTDRGVSVVCVNDDPFPDGREDYRKRGTIIRPWHYKHELILAAMRDDPEIVYCDWDVLIRTKTVDEVQDHLTHPVTLSGYMYRRHRPFKIGRPDDLSKRFNVSGNWLHFADPSFPQTVLDRMLLGKWIGSWHDEMTMNNVVDELNGGWIGFEEWLKRYESAIMVQKHKRTPWSLDSVDGDRVVRKTPIPFVWTRLFSQ